MAYEDQDDFTGYRFLLDASNSREFALRFEDGMPVKGGLSIFAGDVREAKVAPNEVFYAFDDNMKKVKRGNDIFIKTVAYQFTADATGKQFSGKEPVEIEYSVHVSRDMQDNLIVRYLMTEESEDALIAKGYNANFPVDLRQHMPIGQQSVSSSDLQFPPSHDADKAYTARANVSAAPQPQVPAVTQKPSSKPAFQSRAPKLTNPKIPDALLEQALATYSRNLSALAAQGKLDPVVGRDKEIKDSIKILSRRKQSSVCYTGDAGVGKSAMYAGVAQYIANDVDVPADLRGAQVIELDLQAMNAGAKYRGQFEERLKPIIDGLKEREGYFRGRKVILAIDEIHSQLTAGKAEGGTDAGNMMKPFLVSKGISVMGTTTDDEYKQHIEKDVALARRFERKLIEQPDIATTKVIIEKLWPLLKEHHGIVQDITADQIDYIVTMTNRYAPNEAQPSKSEKVLDMAGAAAAFRGSDVITHDDIIDAVAQMSGLKSDFLNQSDFDRFLKMGTEVPKEVIGQDAAIKKVVSALKGARSGLNSPKQPWGFFVFQGPSGVGKTELAKSLARYLFGTEDALIKEDMGNYGSAHDVARLTGAPPGYVGYDDSAPNFLEQVRRKPYSIVLLDEIEKADKKIFDVLLPIANDGEQKTNHGKKVLFNNTIIIMTTNLGAKEVTAMLKGTGGAQFGGGGLISKSPEEQEKQLSGKYKKAREEYFRPEMINRIEELGGFITFLPLTQPAMYTLVDFEVKRVNERMNATDGMNVKGVSIEITDEVKKELAEKGFDPSLGARPLRKVVRELLNNPIGAWMMEPANRQKVTEAVAKNGHVTLKVNSLALNDLDQLVPTIETQAPVAATNDNITPIEKAPKRKPRLGGPSV